MTVFDLAAKISLDTSGYERGLSSAADQARSFAGELKSAIGNVLSLSAVAAGVTKTVEGAVSGVKKSVSEYADTQQLVGGIETLYKDSADVIKTYAADAYKTAGMSANEYMDTATSFAATLISGLGGDTAAAASLVDMAITDMSDNANKMGTDIGLIQNAYQGFAKQNYSMLDNLKLGYGGTQAEMYRLLQTAQSLDSSFDAVFSLDAVGHLDAELADIIEAIHIVQTDLGIVGTTAAEAFGTISGSAASAQAAFDNFMSGLANPDADIIALFDQWREAVSVQNENLIPAVKEVFANVGELAGELGSRLFEKGQEAISGLIEGFKSGDIQAAIQEKVQGVADSIKGVFSSLQGGEEGDGGGLSGMFDSLLGSLEELTGIDLSPFTGSIETAFAVLDGLMQGGVSEALSTWVGRLQELTGLDLSTIQSGLEQLGQVVDDVATAFLEGGLDSAISTLMTKLDELTGLDVSGFFGGIQETYDGLVGAFESGGLAGLFSGLWESFQEAGPKILEAGKGILDNIGNLLSQIGQYISSIMPENIKGLVDSIGGFFESLWGYLGVLWEQMQPIVGLIGAGLIEGVQYAWESIQNTFDLLVDSLTNILDFLSAQFDVVVALWEGDFAGAADAIKQGWNSVVEFFGDIIGSIKLSFEDLVGWFTGLGSRMWEGLKGGFSEAIEGVKGIGKKIGEGWEKLFGINSPSRVFAEYGRYMAEGLEVGWNSKIDSVVREMADGVNIPTTSVDFAHSAVGKSSAASINASMLQQSQSGGSATINLVVDGKTLASVILDPLKMTLRQKGESLA